MQSSRLPNSDSSLLYMRIGPTSAVKKRIVEDDAAQVRKPGGLELADRLVDKRLRLKHNEGVGDGERHDDECENEGEGRKEALCASVQEGRSGRSAGGEVVPA